MATPRQKGERSGEMRRYLAQEFGITEQQASNALVALVDFMRPRLSTGVRVCLASWIPEALPLLTRPVPVVNRFAQEPDKLRQSVVQAGIPAGLADHFIFRSFEFLDQRMGTPLVREIRRRVPELAVLEAPESEGSVDAEAGVAESGNHH